jgi:hypothetical protein
MANILQNKQVLVATALAVGTMAALTTFAASKRAPSTGYGRVAISVVEQEKGRKNQKPLAGVKADLRCTYKTVPVNPQPSYAPTSEPTNEPTSEPTAEATVEPTTAPNGKLSKKQAKPIPSGQYNQTLTTNQNGRDTSGSIPLGAKCTVTLRVPGGKKVTNGNAKRGVTISRNTRTVNYVLDNDTKKKSKDNKKSKR